jgi:hypothetical protein
MLAPASRSYRIDRSLVYRYKLFIPYSCQEQIRMSSTKPLRKTTTTVAKKSVVASPQPARVPRAATPKAGTNTTPSSVPATPPAKPKHKLVRDSFTIPKSEYAVLEGLKDRAAKLTRPVKKGELLRAGISALHKMTDKAFLAAVNDVPSLKTGRPKAPGAVAVAPRATK